MKKKKKVHTNVSDLHSVFTQRCQKSNYSNFHKAFFVFYNYMFSYPTNGLNKLYFGPPFLQKRGSILHCSCNIITLGHLNLSCQKPGSIVGTLSTTECRSCQWNSLSSQVKPQAIFQDKIKIPLGQWPCKTCQPFRWLPPPQAGAACLKSSITTSNYQGRFKHWYRFPPWNLWNMTAVQKETFTVATYHLVYQWFTEACKHFWILCKTPKLQ